MAGCRMNNQGACFTFVWFWGGWRLRCNKNTYPFPFPFPFPMLIRTHTRGLRCFNLHDRFSRLGVNRNDTKAENVQCFCRDIVFYGEKVFIRVLTSYRIVFRWRLSSFLFSSFLLFSFLFFSSLLSSLLFSSLNGIN